MKKRIIATALAAAAGSVLAAPGIQIYGLLDTGVEHLTNADASGGSVTRLPTLTGGQLPSRLGFRGDEDLGGGLHAIFTLESGLAVNTGSFLQSGRAFGRGAFLGLANSWGSVTAGRQMPAAYYAFVGADVIGPSAFSLYALDIYPAMAWVDNSLAYRGKFGGLTVAATYSLGRDVSPPGNCPEQPSGHGNACRAESLLLRWDDPAQRWGASLGYDEQRGGGAGGFIVISGHPLVAARDPGDKDRRLIASGHARFGAATFGAGWVRRAVRTTQLDVDTNLWFAGVHYPFTQSVSVDAQLAGVKDKAFAADATMAVVRANYAFSKRTAVYASVGHMHNKGNANYSISVTSQVPSLPAAGMGQTGFMVGLRHSF